MKGRTEENIKKSREQMHKIAEIIFDQELEVIPSYIEHRPLENNNRAVWYLGASIQMLSEADFFIGIECCDFFNGCHIESEVARRYGIRSTFVRMYEIMPDAAEIERKSWETIGSCIPVV
jgi:hypothetical protein